MSEKTYDSVSFIKQVMESEDVSQINDLLEARRAAYGRKESLQQLVVLKSIMLDSDGRLKEIIYGNLIVPPDLPAAISKNDLVAAIQKHNQNKTIGLTFVNHNQFLPESHYICPFCEKGWTVENMFWCEAVHSSEEINLDKYLGMKLEEFSRLLSLSKKKACFILSCHNQSSHWIKQNIERSEYVISSSDKLTVDFWTYYHRSCYEEMLHQQNGTDLLDLLVKNGFRSIEHIGKKYPKYDPISLSQYRFQSDFGLIQIVRPKKGRESFFIFELMESGNLDLNLGAILKGEMIGNELEVGEKFFRINDPSPTRINRCLSKISQAGKQTMEDSVSMAAKKLESARMAMEMKERGNHKKRKSKKIELE